MGKEKRNRMATKTTNKEDLLLKVLDKLKIIERIDEVIESKIEKAIDKLLRNLFKLFVGSLLMVAGIVFILVAFSVMLESIIMVKGLGILIVGLFLLLMGYLLIRER